MGSEVTAPAVLLGHALVRLCHLTPVLYENLVACFLVSGKEVSRFNCE